MKEKLNNEVSERKKDNEEVKLGRLMELAVRFHVPYRLFTALSMGLIILLLLLSGLVIHAVSGGRVHAADNIFAVSGMSEEGKALYKDAYELLTQTLGADDKEVLKMSDMLYGILNSLTGSDLESIDDEYLSSIIENVRQGLLSNLGICQDMSEDQLSLLSNRLVSFVLKRAAAVPEISEGLRESLVSYEKLLRESGVYSAIEMIADNYRVDKDKLIRLVGDMDEAQKEEFVGEFIKGERGDGDSLYELSEYLERLGLQNDIKEYITKYESSELSGNSSSAAAPAIKGEPGERGEKGDKGD